MKKKMVVKKRRIMMENQNSSKYCYENGTLFNKFNTQNKELLRLEEIKYSVTRIAEIENAIANEDEEFLKQFRKQNHTMNYLNIHKYIFGDVYNFAGEIRDEAIHKTNEPYYPGVTPFCYPTFIFDYLRELLSSMYSKARFVKSREELVDFLVSYYIELNMVHPFREGNGRTLRTFLKLFVYEVNNELSFEDVEINYSLWSKEDRQNLLKATIESSFSDNHDGLIHFFDKVTVYKEKKNNLKK